MDAATLIGLVSLVVAIIGLLITIFEKWNVIHPKIVSLYGALPNTISVNYNFPRRKIIIAGVVIATSAVIAYSLRFFNIHPNHPIKTTTNSWSKYSNIDKFIVNKKNGTIHLKETCDDHLPLLQTTVKNPIASHIHRSKQQQITKIVLKNLSDELREELLIDAIKASPTSSHLYKYLIKQWGRQKEYTKIHTFLSINIKYIKLKLTSSTREKEKRKYLKAISELGRKKSRAEYLASLSKFS